jgi:hypothetical protein
VCRQEKRHFFPRGLIFLEAPHMVPVHLVPSRNVPSPAGDPAAVHLDIAADALHDHQLGPMRGGDLPPACPDAIRDEAVDDRLLPVPGRPVNTTTVAMPRSLRSANPATMIARAGGYAP